MSCDCAALYPTVCMLTDVGSSGPRALDSPRDAHHTGMQHVVVFGVPTPTQKSTNT